MNSLPDIISRIDDTSDRRTLPAPDAPENKPKGGPGGDPKIPNVERPKGGQEAIDNLNRDDEATRNVLDRMRRVDPQSARNYRQRSGQ